MGVDSKAIIRPGTNLGELVEFIEKRYGEVVVDPTHAEYFFYLRFRDGEDNRLLAVFYDRMAERDYGIHGVLLSLGLWGNAVDILKGFCEEFGGYLDENDCDDEDYYPINPEKFSKGREFTKHDEFVQKIVKELGYQNVNKTLALFEEYKNVIKL